MLPVTVVRKRAANNGVDKLPVTLRVGQVTQFYIDPTLVLTDVDLTVNGDMADLQ